MIILITRIWDREAIPGGWREALIVRVHKKGNTICGNYRGISLLITAYKMLSHILLRRLSPISENVLEEYQCGFRKGRSTSDQLFNIRQLMEKRWEYALEIHHLFIIYKQAYGSICSESLWTIMEDFGFHKKLIRMTKVCVCGSKSRVKLGGNISQPFEIRTGLRRGDTLSPLLFNLVLEKVMTGVKRNDAGVPLGRVLRAFGYADDIDLVCNSEEGLRRMFGALETGGNGVGLVVSEEKTK